MRKNILKELAYDYEFSHKHPYTKSKPLFTTSNSYNDKRRLNSVKNEDKNDFVKEEPNIPTVIRKVTLNSAKKDNKRFNVTDGFQKPRTNIVGLSRHKHTVSMLESTCKTKEFSIEIYPASNNNLETHPINKNIKMLNKFTDICTKCKDNGTLNKYQLLVLGRIFKTTKNYLNPVKDKGTMLELKEKLLRNLYQVINTANKIDNTQLMKGMRYKAYISSRNNQMIVKAVLREHGWSFTDSIDFANLIWTQWKENSIINLLKKAAVDVYNHLEGSTQLGNKKELYYNMKSYYERINKDPFKIIPLTFHVSEGVDDLQFTKFREMFEEMREQKVWIIKPGEHSNRGQRIKICRSVSEVREIIEQSCSKEMFIVQKYIEKPLLINKRKFNLRCYGLVTSHNGNVKGYLRTSSKKFTLKNLESKATHLTNEAVQEMYEDFGKFEPDNELTYKDFNLYLQTTYTGVDFYRDLLSQIRILVGDTMRATHQKLDPLNLKHSFEIFGYDFMIDESFHIYLIEVNANPCLGMKSLVTARIIPAMLNSAFHIALDPIFQQEYMKKNVLADVIQYELIYDSNIYLNALEGLDKKK